MFPSSMRHSSYAASAFAPGLQEPGRPPNCCLSPEQRVALDFSYIDQWSLALDLKILARTLPAMFKRTSVIS